MTQTITRKPYKGTSQTLPVLGFGLMRLPQKDGKIDMETAQTMVDLAMEHGCNYFDTAYIYHEGESERFTAKAFAKYPRSSYILATKMPTVHLKKKEDMERIFNEQLERTQAGYFDIYLMHWLNEDHWKTALDLDLYAFMKEKQAQGLIRKIGFSFHGTPELLEKIAEAYPWDIAQIQLNYL
ncbi:MAG: aldo/keto reductase, partial [Lentisphaeria bacterium]|nr:aldo/keto reductase [Lentisphaeria bacterium]